MSKDFVGGRDEQTKKFDESASNYNGDWESLEKMGKVSKLLSKGELVGGVGSIKTNLTRIVSAYLYDGKDKTACSNSNQYSKASCGAKIALFEFRDVKWLFVKRLFVNVNKITQ